MPRKGQKHDAAAREAISRGTKRGIEVKRILEERNAEFERLLYSRSPADIAALRDAGALPEPAHPFADFAAATVLRLRRDAEGPPESENHSALSEQKSALLETAERLLLLAMLEMVRGLEGDSESSARAGTLFGKFAALVKDTLGLDPPEHVYPTPLEYGERKARQLRSGAPIDADPEHCPAAVTVRATAGEGGALVAESPRTPPAAALTLDSAKPPQAE